MTKTRQRFAVVTGFLGALGLAAYLGHRHQVLRQQREEAIMNQVRAFFEPQGPVAVVYVTAVNSQADQARGGVVFEDETVVEFRYTQGVIISRRLKEEEGDHA